MSAAPQPARLPGAEQIRAWARDLGFADAGIAHAHRDLAADTARLRDWLDRGFHGGMDYLARHADLRGDPAALRPGTLAVISARLDYRFADGGERPTPQAVLGDPTLGYISRYALGRDYHRVLRARLLRLARRIEGAAGPHGYRVLADSAPVLEKALARDAGLGWIGKNTLLLHRDAGSWFFLGEIYTDLPLAPAVEAAHEPAGYCGGCRACLNVCPTQAFVGPHQLDARRCISYLTIEHHGPIPLELRPKLGNRIFGCDDCQLVCPWNRYAKLSTEPDFAPRRGLDAPSLLELFGWSETEWLARTEGMALRRVGYRRWLRNLAVALGNAPFDPAVIKALDGMLNRLDAGTDDLVAEHVAWALEQQQLKAGKLPLPEP